MDSFNQTVVSVANPDAFPSATEPSEYVVIKKKSHPNPGFEFQISGLESSKMFRMFIKLEMVNGFVHKYKTKTDVWIQNLPEGGKEDDLPPVEWIEHQDREKTGEHWMSNTIDFSNLSFSLDEDDDSIMLKTLRFYKISLFVRDADGQLFDFHDVRHSFRTLSKHTSKWAAFKKTPGFLNAQRKRRATGRRPAAKRVARAEHVRREEMFNERLERVDRREQFEWPGPNHNIDQFYEPQQYNMGAGVAHDMAVQGHGGHDQLQHQPETPMWSGVQYNQQNAHDNGYLPQDNYQMDNGYQPMVPNGYGQDYLNGGVPQPHGHYDAGQYNMDAVEQHPHPPVQQQHQFAPDQHYDHFQGYPDDLPQNVPAVLDVPEEWNLEIRNVVPESFEHPVPEVPVSTVSNEDMEFLNDFFVTPLFN